MNDGATIILTVPRAMFPQVITYVTLLHSISRARFNKVMCSKMWHWHSRIKNLIVIDPASLWFFMIISCINSSDPKDQCYFTHSLGSINMDNGQSDESSG